MKPFPAHPTPRPAGSFLFFFFFSCFLLAFRGLCAASAWRSAARDGCMPSAGLLHGRTGSLCVGGREGARYGAFFSAAAPFFSAAAPSFLAAATFRGTRAGCAGFASVHVDQRSLQPRAPASSVSTPASPARPSPSTSCSPPLSLSPGRFRASQRSNSRAYSLSNWKTTTTLRPAKMRPSTASLASLAAAGASKRAYTKPRGSLGSTWQCITRP